MGYRLNGRKGFEMKKEEIIYRLSKIRALNEEALVWCEAYNRTFMLSQENGAGCKDIREDIWWRLRKIAAEIDSVLLILHKDFFSKMQDESLENQWIWEYKEDRGILL